MPVSLGGRRSWVSHQQAEDQGPSDPRRLLAVAACLTPVPPDNWPLRSSRPGTVVDNDKGFAMRQLCANARGEGRGRNLDASMEL